MTPKYSTSTAKGRQVRSASEGGTFRAIGDLR